MFLTPIASTTLTRTILFACVLPGYVRYLKPLTDKPELLEACPLRVKRQVWEHNSALFQRQLVPLLDNYIRLARDFWATDSGAGIKLIDAAARRTHSSVTSLVELIGSSVKLYNRVLHAVRSRFLASGNPSYGTLRGDIIMALHDSGVEAVYNKDPVHVFAWGLTACLSPASSSASLLAAGSPTAVCPPFSFDLKRATNVFAEVEKQDQASKIDLDFGLIMIDPHATGAAIKSAMACLVQTVSDMELPADDELLILLVQLLSLGHRLRDRLRDNDFVYSNPADAVVSTALPLLASLLADDELAEVMHGAGDEESEERPLPDGFIDVVNVHPLPSLDFFSLS